MEEAIPTDGNLNTESTIPTITTTDSAALDIIRTETVLSRLPVHNLAKKGDVDIRILRTTPDGAVELKWEVAPNPKFGNPRALAYKLDTIVINRRIEEQGKPLPKMICLGSLRDVADELDLGGDTNKVRRALRQNASAFITAKFKYRGNDGAERSLEADFTRYSVIFTGERLPDGRRADAVYIVLNDPYREVLNNAPVRPLNHGYMKELPPAAQRFYEIVSYKIFAALRNGHPTAKMSYSEYCTFSAQRRSIDWNFVRAQMWQVHKPHLDSGYLARPLRHETIIDKEGNLDWVFIYVPGPRAQEEFAVAHGRKTKHVQAPPTPVVLAREPARKIIRPTLPPVTTFDPELIAEFTTRGITEKKAVELLANLKPGQDVVAQLELGEHLAKKARVPITNPPGFYVRLIESNTTVPDGFETKAKRKAREEQERKEREQRAAEEARRDLEWAYDDYRTVEVERAIAAVDPSEVAAVHEAKLIEARSKYDNAWLAESSAKYDARRELAKRVPLMTIEEFAARRDQQGIGDDAVAVPHVVVESPVPADDAPKPAIAAEDLPAVEAVTPPPMILHRNEDDPATAAKLPTVDESASAEERVPTIPPADPPPTSTEPPLV